MPTTRSTASCFCFGLAAAGLLRHVSGGGNAAGKQNCVRAGQLDASAVPSGQQEAAVPLMKLFRSVPHPQAGAVRSQDSVPAVGVTGGVTIPFPLQASGPSRPQLLEGDISSLA